VRDLLAVSDAPDRGDQAESDRGPRRRGGEDAAGDERFDGSTARALLRVQAGGRAQQRSQLGWMQAGGYLSSRISAARSAAKGRGVERLADGDEGVGAPGAKSKHVGTDAFVRPAERGSAVSL